MMPVYNWEVLQQISPSTSAGVCPAWLKSATVMENIQYTAL